MTGKVETDYHSEKLTYVFNFIEIPEKIWDKKGQSSRESKKRGLSFPGRHFRCAFFRKRRRVGDDRGFKMERKTENLLQKHRVYKMIFHKMLILSKKIREIHLFS